MNPTEISPDEALERLKAGNERFVTGNVRKKYFPKDIEATKHFQDPHTVVLTCSDSRVTPEIIFDKTIGELFVIRVAGNVINPSILGSIEYAVKYLKASYVLILGHTSCGAVGAALVKDDYSPNIRSIIDKIKPAYHKVQGMNLPKEKIYDKLVEMNVYEQVKIALSASEILQQHVFSGKVKIGGAVYDISKGTVEFLD